MLGRRVGSWILERELGRGGMGAVYEARHATLQTRAAVKVLSPGLESEESFRQRFHREANLQVQVRHPNVARVLDYVEDGGQWFLVMDYIEGGSLASLFATGGKVSRVQAIAWTQQALAGLGHAHRHGIVHRDVKPANLLLGANGEIVVMDFGIARADGAPGLTATGATIGTPQYMSPEQIMAPERVDGRSDIYSLGIVLYELLAGRKPFDAGSQFAVLQAQVTEPPPPLRAIDSTIPPQLEAIVLRALAKKPEERYADCESMARDLERIGNAPEPVATGGATVLSYEHFHRAEAPNPAVPSPGELRNARRRAFQRRLGIGVAATLGIATVVAMQLSSEESTPKTQPTAMLASSANPPTATQTSKPVKPPAQQVPVRESRQPVITQPPAFEPAKPGTVVQQPVTPPPAPVIAPTPPPMPAMPPLPEHPRIAVIGMGSDPILAGALEQEMERRLDRYDVADEQAEPQVSELLGKKDVSQQALGAALLKSGFQILVLLRIEEAEAKKIDFRGLEGSVKAARLRLNVYLLPANRSIGRGWTELVEYAEPAAASRARMAFIGPTADLRKAIDDEWAALRVAHAGRGTP